MRFIFCLFSLFLFSCKSVKKDFELKVYLNENKDRLTSIQFKTDTNIIINDFEEKNGINLCSRSNFKGVLTDGHSSTDVTVFFRKNCPNKTYTVFHDIVTIDLNDENILIQNTYENYFIEDKEIVVKKLISIIEEDNKKKNSFLLNWTSTTNINSYYFLLQTLNEVFNELDDSKGDYIPNIIFSSSFSPPAPALPAPAKLCLVAF
ncbi:hypothetical protein [Aquimarina aquimarini]|uniref:hypothetical protein n=1 Tax=Aquimarina aquimarini TaxID=1191734 RepID=UPI000D560F41|nr:hypothetical protein [Aquimarina aquimarini]